MSTRTLTLSALLVLTGCGVRLAREDHASRGDSESTVSCAEPRHYQFFAGGPMSIPCGDAWPKIFAESIPDGGYALAKVTATLSNGSFDQYEPWYDLKVEVGDFAASSPSIDFATG